jgi:hypothetical protein
VTLVDGLISRFEHIPCAQSGPVRRESVLFPVVGDEWNDNIVPPLKKQPAELGKLCGAIRKAMQEHENLFRRLTMVEKLNPAFRADFRGRASDQFPEVPYRLNVGRWFARRCAPERPAGHRQAKDRYQGSRTRYGSDHQHAPERPSPLSVAHQSSKVG